MSMTERMVATAPPRAFPVRWGKGSKAPLKTARHHPIVAGAEWQAGASAPQGGDLFLVVVRLFPKRAYQLAFLHPPTGTLYRAYYDYLMPPEFRTPAAMAEWAATRGARTIRYRADTPPDAPCAANCQVASHTAIP